MRTHRIPHPATSKRTSNGMDGTQTQITTRQDRSRGARAVSPAGICPVSAAFWGLICHHRGDRRPCGRREDVPVLAWRMPSWFATGAEPDDGGRWVGDTCAHRAEVGRGYKGRARRIFAIGARKIFWILDVELHTRVLYLIDPIYNTEASIRPLNSSAFNPTVSTFAQIPAP